MAAGMDTLAEMQARQGSQWLQAAGMELLAEMQAQRFEPAVIK